MGIESDFRPAASSHPGLLVDDVDAWTARLADAGHEVEWDASYPGMRRFYCADPFGNRLEFLQPVDRRV